MVGPRVYHIKHARSYASFSTQDPAKVMDLAQSWLKHHDFHVERKSKQYCRGSKRGIHVNFVPKFKLFIEQGPNGQYIVRFDYYAKIKLGTGIVVGVLTWGVSTVIGVGTLAIALSDADHFVDKFWQYIDSLARGAPVVLTMERWASDGKGNFVKQPIPAGVVPVVAPAAAPPRQPHPPSTSHAPPPPPQSQPRNDPIQPGQVYGHSIMPNIQASAPPAAPLYYPQQNQSANYPPSPQGSYPPPPQGSYPPPPQGSYPQPPSQGSYPPPPSQGSYPPPAQGGYPPPAQGGHPPPPQGYPSAAHPQYQSGSHADQARGYSQSQQGYAYGAPPSSQSSGSASQTGLSSLTRSSSGGYASQSGQSQLSSQAGSAAAQSGQPSSYYAASTDANGGHQAYYGTSAVDASGTHQSHNYDYYNAQATANGYFEKRETSHYSEQKQSATNPSI